MSVAGLKYGPDHGSNRAPMETRSGAFIYNGDAASYHDWEFRTLLRIELLEAQEAAMRTLPNGSGPSLEDEIPTTEAPSASAKRPGHDPEKDIAKDRYTLVSKIMEGLRGDAFLVARDMGVSALVANGGLRDLVKKIKESVFPRASEEAKELFRLGQQRGGILSRQASESMVSYVDRRRRWWRMISEMDSTTTLSESMRAELMIELSGISHQEALVIKAVSGTPLKFEQVGKTLIEHYGSVHLRGGKSMTSNPQVGTYKGINKGKGKGKPPWRTGYFVEAQDEQWFDEDNSYGYDSHHEDYSYDMQHVGLFADSDPVENYEPPVEYADEEIEEWEATALNALGDVEDDMDFSSLGEAVQLELAALASFGKAKGKGKSKGKGKGKGKLVRSNLTLEQRRQKLQEIKARSKCLRCGGTGHWAGDPACRFPNGSKGKSAPSNAPPRAAMMAYISDSSDDDGVTTVALGVGPAETKTAMMGYSVPRPTSKAKAPPKATAIHTPAASSTGAAASSLVYRGPVSDQPLPKPKSKSTAKKKPPNPPLAKCALCSDFSFAGSTAYTVKKTCRDCGFVSTSRRDEVYPYRFEDCPHQEVDHRGSAKNTFRTFCKQCGNFINQIPMEERKHRVAVAKQVEEVPQPTLNVVENISSHEATLRFSHADVQAILSLFTQNLLDSGPQSAAELHQALDTAISMHDYLLQQDPMPESDDPDQGEGWDVGMTLQDLAGPRAFMAVRADQATGDVMLDLPIVDPMDLDDPNIFVALDEGCNSTCHSAEWGKMCEHKLKRHGVVFKWTDRSESSFVGIGSKTSTLGIRSMPLCMVTSCGTLVKGRIDSYEISSGKTPMLLSLYAQCTLGMVKDLENGTCSIKNGGKRMNVPLFKCKRTGLLMINVSAGLFHLENDSDGPIATEHKFLRQFRPPIDFSVTSSASSSPTALMAVGDDAERKAPWVKHLVHEVNGEQGDGTLGNHPGRTIAVDEAGGPGA